MKIAIIHEYLCKIGGAERVLKTVSDFFPNADIYCLVDNGYGKNLGIKNKIHSLTNFLPNFLLKKYQYLFFLYPHLIENLDLSDYDIVISLSNSFSHGVITNEDTLHVSYYHSPMRFIWDYYHEYPKDLKMNKFFRIIWSYFSTKLRVWDFVASKRSDLKICISNVVKKRIKKFYRSDAIIINPPVNISEFSSGKDKGYFLIISRLSAYKNIDLAINAFNTNGKKLIIAGTGDQESYLKSIARDNIEFKGRVCDSERVELLKHCRGFICLNEEDFGLTPIEAMASGKPVFALKKGGYTETIRDDINGKFFTELNIENFLQHFKDFETFINDKFDYKQSISDAKKFSEERFKEEFINQIKSAYFKKTGIEFDI